MYFPGVSGQIITIQQEFSFWDVPVSCAWVNLRNTLACLPNKLELVGISIKMSGRNPDHTIHYYYFVFVGTLRTGRKENSPKNE